MGVHGDKNNSNHEDTLLIDSVPYHSFISLFFYRRSIRYPRELPWRR